jgi:hypothetical protein
MTASVPALRSSSTIANAPTAITSLPEDRRASCVGTSTSIAGAKLPVEELDPQPGLEGLDAFRQSRSVSSTMERLHCEAEAGQCAAEAADYIREWRGK